MNTFEYIVLKGSVYGPADNPDPHLVRGVYDIQFTVNESLIPEGWDVKPAGRIASGNSDGRISWDFGPLTIDDVKYYVRMRSRFAGEMNLNAKCEACEYRTRVDSPLPEWEIRYPAELAKSTIAYDYVFRCPACGAMAMTLTLLSQELEWQG